LECGRVVRLAFELEGLLVDVQLDRPAGDAGIGLGDDALTQRDLMAVDRAGRMFLPLGVDQEQVLLLRGVDIETVLNPERIGKGSDPFRVR
jgi:hypothetical protein